MKNIHHSIRNTKHDVPIGWTSCYDENNYPSYRCGCLQLFPEGYRRCTFTCRKNEIWRHEQNKMHLYPCVATKDPGFPKNLEENIQLKFLKNFRDLFISHTSLFAAQLDFSSRKLLSSEFMDYAIELMLMGARLPSKSQNKDSIRELIGNLNNSMLADSIKLESQKKYQEDLNIFSDLYFINVMVDAGTVNRLKKVHFLISNPTKQKSLLLCSMDNENNDHKKYELAIRDVIRMVGEKNLRICSFISDNLPAQALGIKLAIAGSNDPQVNSIIHIRCFCHSLNLIFTNLLAHVSIFDKMVQKIIELANILRKEDAVNFIGARCPNIIRTRWIYIEDILQFMIIKYDEINSYLTAVQLESFSSIPIEFIELYRILLPIKVLSLAFETRECSLWMVPQLYLNAIGFYKEMKNYINTEFGKEVYKQALIRFQARFATNNKTDVITSFCLSSLGRAYMRSASLKKRTKNSYHLVIPVGYIRFSDILKRFQGEKDQSLNIILKQIANADRTPLNKTQQTRNSSSLRQKKLIDFHFEPKKISSEIQPPVNNLNDIEGDSELNSDDYKSEEGDVEDYKNLVEKYSDFEVVDLLELNVYADSNESLFCIALQRMQEIGKILETDSEYIEDLFNKFVYDDPTEFKWCPLLTKHPDYFWRSICDYDKNWEKFAMIALQFITIQTSEADVERLLSIQKEVLGPKVYHISNDLLEARLRLHSIS